MNEKPGHASSLLDQLKQAQADGDLPDELVAKYDLDEPTDENGEVVDGGADQDDGHTE